MKEIYLFLMFFIIACVGPVGALLIRHYQISHHDVETFLEKIGEADDREAQSD